MLTEGDLIIIVAACETEADFLRNIARHGIATDLQQANLAMLKAKVAAMIRELQNKANVKSGEEQKKPDVP